MQDIMKSLFIFTIFVAVAFAVKQCTKATECGPTDCCLIGMERYSIPQCSARGKVGDWCKEGAEPEDRMLYYPNQAIKNVEGVYTLFCPCSDGLTCKKNKCRKV